MPRPTKPVRQQRALPLRRRSNQTSAEKRQREHEKSALETLFTTAAAAPAESPAATVAEAPDPPTTRPAAPAARPRATVVSRAEILVALASIAFAAGGLTLFVRGAGVRAEPPREAARLPEARLAETPTPVASAAAPALELKPSLEELRGAERWADRARAAARLGQSRNPEAAAALVQSLGQDPDWAVRAAAADALGDLREGRTALERAATQDRERAVRDAAALALRSLARP